MPINMPVFVLLIGSVLWGLTWIPLKFFNQQGIDGIPLTLIAYGIVGLILLPITIKQYPLWRVAKRNICLIFILGGTANLAFAVAMVYGDVIRVMVLFYLLPAWGVLGGKIFLKEEIDKTRWIAVLLALSGAFLVLGGFQLFDSAPSWIDLVALASGFALSMNNIAFRASADLPVMSKIGMQFIGTFALAGLLLLFQVQSMPAISGENLGMVIAFGVIWLFAAAMATQWAITKMEVSRASILIILELVTAVLSAMWIGNEQLSLLETFGGLLIIIAAVLEAFRGDGSSKQTI
ncbi:MAG: DMT family transporter [Gammaproteobacteria bacterium]|nr:DMT family transporter [Gammaproteobacteria bacterium]